MTEVEALKLVAVMTTALPRDWSFLTPAQRKETGAIYVRMLADLPYPAANAAVESLLATATRMPTIAEVRIATLRAMHGDVRPGGDAWGDVLRARAYSLRSDFLSGDLIALRVCDRMGWVKRRTLLRAGQEIEQWCVAMGESEPSDRARFIELYEQFACTARHETNVSQLPAAQRYRALQAAQNPQITEPTRVDFARLLPHGDES
jgi:hypothetical protein